MPDSVSGIIGPWLGDKRMTTAIRAVFCDADEGLFCTSNWHSSGIWNRQRRWQTTTQLGLYMSICRHWLTSSFFLSRSLLLNLPFFFSTIPPPTAALWRHRLESAVSLPCNQWRTLNAVYITH